MGDKSEGKIFIGVDGGGTTTKAVAITGEGKVLGKAVGEGTNFLQICRKPEIIYSKLLLNL